MTVDVVQLLAALADPSLPLAARAALDVVEREPRHLATIAGLEETVRAQAAEIQALRDRLTPPTLWGVNASSAAELARREKALGPVQVVRYFHQPGEGVWWPEDSPKAADRIVLGGRALIYSTKVPVPEQAAGKWDAAWERMMRRAPADRPTWVCPWHEPEDDIARGAFTAAQLRDAFRRVAAVARRVGPHIKVTPILMGYSLTAASGRNWLDYYPGDDACDALGWDVYQSTPTWPTTPDRLFDGVQAASESVGKPWLIAETGANAQAIKGGREPFLRTMAAELVRRGPLAVCYFDNDYWNISNDARAAAAWAAGRLS